MIPVTERRDTLFEHDLHRHRRSVGFHSLGSSMSYWDIFRGIGVEFNPLLSV
jgi:hypothetical protein